jgi:hypothetical protein
MTPPYPTDIGYLAFCKTCNARDRSIVFGRCIICDQPPEKESKASD